MKSSPTFSFSPPTSARLPRHSRLPSTQKKSRLFSASRILSLLTRFPNPSLGELSGAELQKEEVFLSPLPPFSLSQAFLVIADTSPAGDESTVVQTLFVKSISAPTAATLNFRKAITHGSKAATTLATCRIPQGEKAAVLRLCGKKPRLSAHAHVYTSRSSLGRMRAISC